MSNGPRIRAASSLDALTGRRLPGGCDDCTAYQTVDRIEAGFYVLTVHHDPTCPELNRATHA